MSIGMALISVELRKRRGLKVELEDLVAEETRHKEDLERVLVGWRD